MHATKLLRGNPFARSLPQILKEAPAFRLRCALSTTALIPHKPTASQPFHTQAYLFARPPIPRDEYARYVQEQQQRYEQHQQQQRGKYYQHQQQQQQHRNSRPRSSSSTFKSTQFRVIAVVSCGAAAVFYVSNIEEVPVSGRKRFNCYSPESAEAQGEMAYRQILEQERRQGKILPEWDPRSRMVQRVMARLIEGGKLGTGAAPGKGVGWEIHVIDDPETKNAFVLPGGKVFVYTGILPICRNDSGLAAVLGHEISHNLCGHATERMSSMVVVQAAIYCLMAVEVMYTGANSGISSYLGSILLDLGVMRPSSRQQENEADQVGLLLMAQSCYDPKEAVGLWKRMELAEHAAPPEWISTHPSNEHRIERITALLPKAEEERNNSGCAATASYSNDFKRALQENFW